MSDIETQLNSLFDKAWNGKKFERIGAYEDIREIKTTNKHESNLKATILTMIERSYYHDIKHLLEVDLNG